MSDIVEEFNDYRAKMNDKILADNKKIAFVIIPTTIRKRRAPNVGLREKNIRNFSINSKDIDLDVFSVSKNSCRSGINETRLSPSARPEPIIHKTIKMLRPGYDFKK